MTESRMIRAGAYTSPSAREIMAQHEKNLRKRAVVEFCEILAEHGFTDAVIDQCVREWESRQDD